MDDVVGTLVEFEARRHLDSGGHNIRATDERFLAYVRAVDPATSAVLSGTRLLPAAQTLFGEACNWAGTAELATRAGTAGIAVGDVTGRRQTLAWEVVRDAAEAVATAHGIEPGAIHGAASILLVEGNWWDLVAPRFALCSLAAATDPNTASAMLYGVFESGLTAA